MLRSDLQALTRLRLREARKLLRAREHCGAYYLTGLAIECAIKACIAKQTRRYEFPDKNRGRDCFEHDPTKLVKLAGLFNQLEAEEKQDPVFSVNWGVVKDWKVESRYDATISKQRAQGPAHK